MACEVSQVTEALFHAHISKIDNSNKKKRISFFLPTGTGKCCTEFNILTIEQSYYSTHQLYLFLLRHISVLIRILYTKTEGFHFSKLIQKWLVKSVKSLKHSSMHTFQKLTIQKRRSFSFLLYRKMLYRIQHSDHRTELLFYSPVVSFPVKTYLCVNTYLIQKVECLYLSTA